MMTTQRLKWLAIILPIIFSMIVLFLRDSFFGESNTFESDLFAFVLFTLGAVVFSAWVFRTIARREAEIKQGAEQLAALHTAGLALTTELDLETVLQKVVDLARSLVNARYGALGVLDEEGEYIAQFITSGISSEERTLLGELPRGHGLLGALIRDGTPIRIPSIAGDSRSVGFPPHHPPMHSLLGVPIQTKGKIIGDLYMTDKIGEGRDTLQYTIFTEQDQHILEMFATQAAIAIENAQLYRQTQQLAILKERERFGMDLHDGIIQSVYAVGLMLEDGQQRMESEPAEAKVRIERAIRDLNEVIHDIRNYILDLRPQRFQERDLKRGLEELARGLRANTFLNVTLHLDSPDLSALSPEKTVEVLHVVQEACTNVRKHARASNVDLRVARDDRLLLVTIEDDGIGFDWTVAGKSAGHGIENMRERARAVRGTLRVERREGGGTRITLRAPI